jgi:hypothetical protein
MSEYEQEEFKNNIEELLRDREIALDTIVEQQKQIASMMEDAKRMKDKLKISKAQETALHIAGQQKQEDHERQIAGMKEDIRQLVEDIKLENARRKEDASLMEEKMMLENARLREEMKLENARRIEDARRTEDNHWRQIADMEENMRRLEEKQRGKFLKCRCKC